MNTTTRHKSVLVYGPQGCGKTRNSKAIAKALGLTTIIDSFEMGNQPWPRNGALLLTSCIPPERFPCRAMSFEQAMNRVPA